MQGFIRFMACLVAVTVVIGYFGFRALLAEFEATPKFSDPPRSQTEKRKLSSEPAPRPPLPKIL